MQKQHETLFRFIRNDRKLKSPKPQSNSLTKKHAMKKDYCAESFVIEKPT